MSSWVAFMVASMGMLGAVLAQATNDFFHRRRSHNEKVETTKSVLRSMISDLDYCSGFLRKSEDYLSRNEGQISPHQIQYRFQAYAHQYFDVKHLIMTGLYHRYQQPIGFAERLSDLWSDDNEYRVDEIMQSEINDWSRYCAYLAGALEEVVDNPFGGNIQDYADYPSEKIDQRLRKFSFTDHTQSRLERMHEVR